MTETLLLVRSFARFASLRLSVVDSAVDAILFVALSSRAFFMFC